MRRRLSPTATPFAIALVLGLAVLSAACSADSGSTPATTSTTSAAPADDPPTDLAATTTTTIGPVRLGIRSTSLGDIVVDSDGMTLYAEVPGTDGCTGTCLDVWPAVRATSVSVDPALQSTPFAIVDPNAAGDTTGTTAAEPSATDPADPTPPTAAEPTTTLAPPAEGIVTVAGRTLHRFLGDAVPGDTTGQAFNGTFFVVLADGRLVVPSTTTTTTSTP